jgi:hypothetical protein
MSLTSVDIYKSQNFFSLNTFLHPPLPSFVVVQNISLGSFSSNTGKLVFCEDCPYTGKVVQSGTYVARISVMSIFTLFNLQTEAGTVGM